MIMESRDFSRAAAVMYFLLIWTAACKSQTGCPPKCSCDDKLITINCKGRGLSDVPSVFPSSAKTIDLSANSISMIGNAAFSSCPSLETLYLIQNKITEVVIGAFTNCSNLAHLDLSGNKIGELKTSVFYPTLHLKSLKASQNSLKVIPNLERLAYLEEIILDTNDLTSVLFPSGFQMASKLQHVTLSNNPLVTKIDAHDFGTLTAVKYLAIAACNIQAVEPGSFRPLANSLISLSLSGNNPLNNTVLQTILNDFSGSSTLISLELARMGLSGTISASTFSILGNDSRVSTIDLSGNKLLQAVDPDTFSNLKQLVSLSISGAHLGSVPNLAGNSQLRNLDLSSNSIEGLESKNFPLGLLRLDLQSNKISSLTQPFRQLSSLTYLDLSHNQISSVPSNSLDGLLSVITIDLSGNELSYLPDQLLGSLVKLQSLDLSHNAIHRINSSGEILGGTPQLMSLDLSNNGLSQLPPRMFHPSHGLVKLRVLDLSSNALGYGFNCFPNLYADLFNGLLNLTSLNLSLNGVASIPARLIGRIGTNATIDMSSNMISSWDGQNMFQNGAPVLRLSLSNNQISTLKESSINELPVVNVLDLTNNPFACNCDLVWFHNWINETNVTLANLQAYTCASPDSVRGTSFLAFQLTVMDCWPTWYWIVIGVSAGLLIVLVFGVILIRYRWKIAYKLHRCCGLCRCHESAGSYERIEQAQQYAAFLSYCQQERCAEFVLTQILPAIEMKDSNQTDGLYPIMHRAKMHPGQGYFDFLEEAVSGSLCTIVVVCKHYKKDRKLELELELAIQEELDSSHKIILVLTEGMSVSDIPQHRCLRTLLESNEYIEWRAEIKESCLQRVQGKLADEWRQPPQQQIDPSTD